MVRVELVTTLKCQTTKTLAELHASKEPVLITEHGQSSAYLVDVEGFEFMQQRMTILEAIAINGEVDKSKRFKMENCIQMIKPKRQWVSG